MSDIGRIAALAVAGALCAAVVRKQAPEIAMVLAIAAGAALLFSCAEGISYLLDLLTGLAETGGISAAAVRPVIKVAGIAIVTRIAADICRDAHESGLASTLETGGTVLALAAAAPMLSAVLNAITELL